MIDTSKTTKAANCYRKNEKNFG